MASGDVGHLDAEGRLFVDGRDDDMIVSGGENVFPGEVEDLLLRHPAIADAAVLGVDDERFGQRLRAVVVRRPGAALTEDEVRAHVKARLAGYKVPRDVEFRDGLPRTTTGKVLKRELAGQGAGAA
jgi:fatty-acyl-CoA synthase